MICTVHKIKNCEKWAICFYDWDGQRNDRNAEFFDREVDAMNRVAELIAVEKMRYLPGM